jgi:protein SCO1/2
MTAARAAPAVGLLLALLALLARPDGAVGASGPPVLRLDPQKAMERSQSVVGATVADHRLTDQNGTAFSLGAYRGKPLVLSLVYSACSSLCPITTQHLIDAVQTARRAFGADRFQVLTVGFDARTDTPARMAQFAAGQRIDLSNWRVASGDAATLRALLTDVGFSYAEIAGGFDHIAQTTIIDRDGRVYRQVYGEDFPLTMFMEPLREAIRGTSAPLSVGGILDRIRFVCTTFDPGAGRYRIDYGLIFGSTLGALSLAAMAGLIVREWRRTGRA